jgi:hypothetical protein
VRPVVRDHANAEYGLLEMTVLPGSHTPPRGVGRPRLRAMPIDHAALVAGSIRLASGISFSSTVFGRID